MKKTNCYKWARLQIIALLIAVMVTPYAFAKKPGWQREEVNWRMSGGGQIKGIEYPEGKKAPISHKRAVKKPRKTPILTPAGFAFANVIESPPVDGFVPWIAVSVTNARLDSDVFDAVTEYSITGNYLTGTPEANYIVGIYDTGASAHVMGNAAGNNAGIFGADLITSNTSVISGVTGEVEAWVSQPIGIFIDGLGAIEPNGLLWNRSGMKGQSNVAIMVGQGGQPVDLPTAIGSPLSVYFTAVFNNETQITVNHDGNDFNGPDIRIYEQDDPEIPVYSNLIPLELRPLGATGVQYIPILTDLFDFEPGSPSVITGTSSQSVFFVASVDLYEGTHSAIDKTRFMFDTGAQVSVIGSRVAARLGLDPAEPDFEVEIQGVTGVSEMFPGFYIDTLDIPALGDWLSLTNVPVVLLDVPSPEGGTVDGIIGMNLFADLNFVLRGGGLFLQDDPMVEYEPIATNPLIGDIAPPGGDGVVDYLDLAAISQAWLTTPQSPNWNAQADSAVDDIIDFRDYAILAQNWE